HLGQADDAVLGGDVGRLRVRCDQSVDRGDVDDATVTACLHAGQGAAHGVEGGREVDGDDRIPLGYRERLHPRHMLDAGVVDQDVDAPETLFGGGDHRLDLVGAAEVGIAVVDLDAVRGDLRAGLFDLFRRAQAIEHDLASGLSQAAGNGQADAAGGAGD